MADATRSKSRKNEKESKPSYAELEKENEELGKKVDQLTDALYQMSSTKGVGEDTVVLKCDRPWTTDSMNTIFPMNIIISHE